MPHLHIVGRYTHNGVATLLLKAVCNRKRIMTQLPILDCYTYYGVATIVAKDSLQWEENNALSSYTGLLYSML